MELESDALSRSKAIISDQVGRSRLDLLVEDIRMLSSSFTSFNVFHVKRCGNTGHIL